MALSVDVVIPTYGGWELTHSCLEHLRRQTREHRVIVSDNSSPDNTPDKVRGEFPEVEVVETGGNLGFPVACNRGAAAGSGDVIVLLNNDVDARPDFLERLIAPLEQDEHVGMVAGTMVMPGEERIDSVGLAADRTLSGFARHHGRPLSEASRAWPRLIGPSGGAGAYRRAAWEQSGGLDERVFIYLEDLDLALRLAAEGWRAEAAPDAVGIHLGSATMGQRSAWQRRQAGFSRAYFIRRYGAARGPAALRTIATEAVVVLGDLILSRDLVSLASRRDGWRAAGGLPRKPVPPSEALESRIGFRDSLRMRRATI